MPRKGTMSANDTSTKENPEKDVVDELEDDVEEENEDEQDLEDVDPNTEIWDGGPTVAQVNAWKEAHGENNVFVTSVGPETHVVWRTITRYEYRNIVRATEMAVASDKVSQTQANMDTEEAITETCTLYPRYSRENNITNLGGLAALLSQQIMEASGFVATDVRGL